MSRGVSVRLAGLSSDERLALGRERVLERVIRHPVGCWEWPGGKVAEGYGALNVRLGGRGGPKVMLYVHRVIYEELVGPVPDGWDIDHLCCNRGCPNPEHLEAVTHAENIRRGKARAKRLREGFRDGESCTRVCSGDPLRCPGFLLVV